MPGLVVATLGDQTASWLATSGLKMASSYVLGSMLVVICLMLMYRLARQGLGAF